MFKFQHFYYLYFVAILPVMVLLYYAMVLWRKKKIRRLGNEKLIADQILGYDAHMRTFKFIILSVSLFLIIMGCANLQTFDKNDEVQRKGIDVVIALDVSKSMLAKDIQPDRLTRAKQFIMSISDKMKTNRMALIIFAGRAYLQVPLTIDYSAVKMKLQNVSPDKAPAQGTVIGEAVELAMKSFSQNERKYKSLIIISDGEDHDDAAIEKTREAAESGVIVHTVGIGSPQGTTLFDPETKALKLDEDGSPVISKLNEDELRSIANAGHGTYSLLQNSDEVARKIVTELDAMEQKSLGSVVYTHFISYFQYFLLIGFIIVLVEWLLPGRKSTAKKKNNESMA